MGASSASVFIVYKQRNGQQVDSQVDDKRRREIRERAQKFDRPFPKIKEKRYQFKEPNKIKEKTTNMRPNRY